MKGYHFRGTPGSLNMPIEWGQIPSIHMDVSDTTILFNLVQLVPAEEGTARSVSRESPCSALETSGPEDNIDYFD